MQSTSIPRVETRVNLLAEQTSIRRTLRENGYAPLPAHEKMVTLRGWPKIEATPDLIENWALSTMFCTTAIRIEGDLVAIDVDVDDDDMADILLDRIMRKLPQLNDAPLRYGKGAKFMILARCPEQPKILTSHVWLRGGEDSDTHRVEMYGSGTTRYFTCFGPHTEGEATADGVEVLIEYEWDDQGPSPLTARPEDLPEVSVAELRSLIDIANEDMEAAGWGRLEKSRSGVLDLDPVFDLTDDMTFDCADGETRGLRELAGYAKSHTDARCSASWREMGAVNLTRCRVRLWHDGSPEVTDYAEYRPHLPVDADKRTPGEKKAAETSEVAKELGKVLTLAGYNMSEYPGAEVDDEAEAQLHHLMDNMVFVAGDDRYHLIDDPDTGLRRSALMQSYNLRVTYEKVDGRSGAIKEASTTTGKIFLGQEAMKKVSRVSFDPREGRIYGEAPHLSGANLNAYGGLPELGEAEPELVELVKRHFLPHLIPHAEERLFVIDWLKAKYENPAVRNCALLFLAPGVSGTGRGTLFSILKAMFGRYSIKLKEDQLFEKHNGWADRKLLALADEIGGGSRFHDRQEDYQRLKDLVDPLTTTLAVRRMREDSVDADVFISFILATNRINGIRFDAEDRRFAVITNGEMLELVREPWANEFMAVVRARGGLDRLAAAMAALLHEHRAHHTARQLTTPPKFAGWHAMVDASKSDLDVALDELADEYRGELKVWTTKAFKQALRLKLSGGMSGTPRRGDGVASVVSALSEKGRAKAVGITNLGVVTVGERVIKMHVLCNDPETFMAMSIRERGEVLGVVPGVNVSAEDDG